MIIVHVGEDGPVEVARHARANHGSPMLDDSHLPPAPAGALARTPKARTIAEVEFLALGDGARLWLTEATAAEAQMRVKMADAVATAKFVGPELVDPLTGQIARPGAAAPPRTSPATTLPRPHQQLYIMIPTETAVRRVYLLTRS